MSNRQVYTDSRKVIHLLLEDDNYTMVAEVYKGGRIIAALFEKGGVT